MSLDSRIRDELLAATESHELDEEAALRAVKTQAARADVTVVPLEDGSPPLRPHARSHRIVSVLAAAALIAGAIAVPFALRDQSSETATPADAVGGSGTRYRSTVVVRVEPPPATPTSMPPGIELTDPGQIAMRSGTRKAALERSHLDADDPRVSFGPTTANATGELSLTVTAPTVASTTALARNWAMILTETRIAEAKTQTRAVQHELAVHVRELHQQLRKVDRQLATLMPGVYGSVEFFDSPTSRFPGRQQGGPPPVPEQGSPKVLNLAFERIQLLTSLTESGEKAAVLRINVVKPDVFAQVVSQSAPELIQAPDESNTSTILIAVGLLAAGVLLAGSAFLLGRRSRRPQPS